MRIFLLLFIIFPSVIFSDSLIESPKRELRAVWMATVFNIDWPSKAGLPPELQKEELIKSLDAFKEMKLNAVILQVKPTSDAFYESKMSPWSKFLTGKQGVTPSYDPLEFFIEEAQKRSIETHVWVNPFRILNGGSFSELVPEHIAKKNPDWVIEYDKKYYFDPGNPKVQAYITKEVMELVKKYDIDVLHMDDYFYPYRVYKKGKAIEFNDNASWNKYGKIKFKNRADWRRDNVNKFIETLAKEIKKEKSYVKFGVSPFGVWRNKDKDPLGSNTKAGQTNYDDLYADVLLWLENAWVDYIMPQIYWHFDTKPAPYGTLVDWWRKMVPDNINLYIGLGVYKLGEQNWPNTHIREQINYIRSYPCIDGASYYSAKWLVNDTRGIRKKIAHKINKYHALVPINPQVRGDKPFAPEKITLKDNILTWENKDPENTRYFIVYKFKQGEIPNLSEAANIYAKVSASLPLKITIDDPESFYGVTSVSRLHQESTLSQLIFQE